MKSRTFTLRELEHSLTAKRLNIDNKCYKVGYLVNLLRLRRTILYPIYDFMKKPLNITSAYRSKSLNQSVGGVPDSYHTFGCAVDIQLDSNDNSLIVEILQNMRLPFDKVIVYGRFRFLHIQIPETPKEEPKREIIFKPYN